MSAGLPVSQSCRPLPASNAHSPPSSEALPPFMQLISLRTPGPIQEGLKFAEICDNVITVWRFKYATILRYNTAFHFSPCGVALSFVVSRGHTRASLSAAHSSGEEYVSSRGRDRWWHQTSRGHARCTFPLKSGSRDQHCSPNDFHRGIASLLRI